MRPQQSSLAFNLKQARVRPAQALLQRILPFLLLFSTGLTALAAEDSSGAPSPIPISKVSFLIHPVCWDLALAEGGRMRPDFRYQSFTYRGGAWYDEQEFYEILEWERRVNRKQKEYIRAMGPDEALVIYPIGNRPAMQALENEGRERLGRRCLIIRSESPSANRKVDYRQLLPDAVKIGLLDELLEAVRHNSDTWNAQALEVIFYNRMIALEIEREFQKRRLQVDPKRVEALAFGEGFEQCATTWKAMVGTYLGWSRPIEIDYNLSVSGMPLLRGARFKERVAVGEEVRMFLWELEDGRPMAWFVRTRGSLAQAQLFVSLPFDLKAFKLFDEFGAQLWPDPVRETQHLGGVHWWWMGSANDSPLRFDLKGPVRVPVSVGLRQLPTDRNIFIVSSGIPFDEFRRALTGSAIGPAP